MKIKQIDLCGFTALTPHISGETFITGFNQLFLEKNDIFKYGWTEDGTGLTI